MAMMAGSDFIETSTGNVFVSYLVIFFTYLFYLSFLLPTVITIQTRPASVKAKKAKAKSLYSYLATEMTCEEKCK